MKDLLARLTSRTFWVTVFTIGVMVTNEQYTEAASVAIAYVLGEKAIDTAGTLKNRKVVPGTVTNVNVDSTASDDGLDRSDVVTGAHRIKTFDERVDDDK